MFVYQNIEQRSVNFVQVLVGTEAGCNPADGEYELEISGVLGSLDISANGGVDDISLIKECVDEAIPSLNLPEEGYTEIVLKEHGEWQDVFWVKYYQVQRVVRFPS